MIETKETLQVMSMFMEMKYLLSYLYMSLKMRPFIWNSEIRITLIICIIIDYGLNFNELTFTFDEYDSIKCGIYLWSGKSQEKQSSLSMFVSLALFGKKSARSVARIQCLMFPNTSRYSSGLSFANMLWFSLIQ